MPKVWLDVKIIQALLCEGKCFFFFFLKNVKENVVNKTIPKWSTMHFRPFYKHTISGRE